MRAKGGISLTAEDNGSPVAIPVYFNGVSVGMTPFVSEVPLCTKISVGDKFNQDTIPVDIKFHETVEYNYNVRRSPSAAKTSEVSESVLTSPVNDESSKSVPTNINLKKEIRWIPLGISAAAFVAGVVVAVVENSKAKSTYEKKPASKAEYNKNADDIDSAQTGRAVGIGLAIAGAIGIGLSFVF